MWRNLRWTVKAIIIAIPILLIGYFGTKYNWFNSTSTTDTNIISGNNSSQNKSVEANENSNATNKNKTGIEHRDFAFTPIKPVNGELKGVVEVGASGFNSFVVNIDKEKNWEAISKDFGQSFVYEGLASTDDIRMGLKKYIASMAEKGVKSKNIHFVISSGAQKEPKTAIIASELKKMGYVVNLVTAEQEGKLALKSVLPKQYYDNSFVVDIGSGNTKISYPNGATLTSMEAPGAKYYEKDMTDAFVYNEVKSKALTIPKNKSEVCFIIGGVPFELAKQTRQNDERYTVLAASSKYIAGDKKKVACGLNIYKALQDATGCDTFVFDWDANFSIGFLLSL
jgi:hypothetical protein